MIAPAARNFATGVAYGKTEVVQAAVFEVLFLGAVLTPVGALGIAIATIAVMLMSLVRTNRPLAAFLGELKERGLFETQESLAQGQAMLLAGQHELAAAVAAMARAIAAPKTILRGPDGRVSGVMVSPLPPMAPGSNAVN